MFTYQEVCVGGGVGWGYWQGRRSQVGEEVLAAGTKVRVQEMGEEGDYRPTITV